MRPKKRSSKKIARQAKKEDKFAARKRMLPDPRTQEQKAKAFRDRRNSRLARAAAGLISAGVIGGGEYNVRQRKG